jgi:hypothetical protein
VAAAYRGQVWSSVQLCWRRRRGGRTGPSLDGEVGDLSDHALDALLIDCGTARSTLAGVEASVLAEIERRGRWSSGVLCSTQRVGNRAARRAAKRARRLHGVGGGSGLAAVAASLGCRRLTPEHVDAVVMLPDDSRDANERDEAKIVAKAEILDYDAFVQWLARWRADIDRDAGRSPADRQRKDRKASSGPRAADGMHLLNAAFEPLVGAAIDKQIAVVDQAMWRIDCRLPATERRTPAQRRADALAWLVLRPVRATALELPGADDLEIEAALGRSDLTIMIIATIDDVRQGRGELVDGTQVDLDDAIRAAAQVNIIPAVFDTNGMNLWQGRKSRLPSEGLRRAVIARDRHCTFPDCNVPATWTQLHHIIWWSRGGTTDPWNLCLLCSEHHHFVHDLGWLLERLPDGSLKWQRPAPVEVDHAVPEAPAATPITPRVIDPVGTAAPGGGSGAPMPGAGHDPPRRQPPRSGGADGDADCDGGEAHGAADERPAA